MEISAPIRVCAQTETHDPARCAACCVGSFYEVGQGGACPWLEVRIPAGTWLYQIHEPATSYWFLRRGQVEQVGAKWEPDDPSRLLQAPAFLGLQGGRREARREGLRAVTDLVACRVDRLHLDHLRRVRRQASLKGVSK